MLIFVMLLGVNQVVAENSMKAHHSSNELSCDDCHTSNPLKAVAMDQCLSCHDAPEPKENYEGEPDKHDSPHYGPELDCDSCHREHEESVNFCAECHEYDFKVP